MIKDHGGQGSKADIINQALSMLRISGLTIDPTPEDTQLALTVLEGFAAELALKNMDGGYNFQDQPDAGDAVGVNRGFWTAYAASVAVRLCPAFGKQVPPELHMTANSAMSAMVSAIASDRMRKVQPSARTPLGSGNSRYWNGGYYPQPQDTKALAGADVMFADDIVDLVAHFDADLDYVSNEFIDTFTITSDSTITILESSNTDADINYRITSKDGGKVVIVVTTTTGRVLTHINYVAVNDASITN